MSGYVYAVAANIGMVKIGYSTKPHSRFVKIQSDCCVGCQLLGFIPGTPADEERLHGRLTEHHVRGEWFRLNSAVRSALAHIIGRGLVEQRNGLNGIDPARTVIEKVGGVDVASALTGRHVSRIYRWMSPREAGGTGGLIPQPEAVKLLDGARARGIALHPSDFFPSSSGDVGDETGVAA